MTAGSDVPGAFRTDFPGRSLGQSSTVIDDYADTAGRRRKERDIVRGTQKGDPAKAAQALITAVEPRPAALLLLGRDALDAFRQIHEAQRAEQGTPWADPGLRRRRARPPAAEVSGPGRSPR